MQLLKHTKYWIAGIVVMMAIACSKDYYQYEQYIDNGPLIYPGRPDTLQALAGKERIQLRWAVPSDLNITGYKVFWNFGNDSLPVPGRTIGSNDSISLYINNLPEGTYNFTVYAYDKPGHRSVGTQTTGNVYGANFYAIIFNRPYSLLKRDTAASKLLVTWVGREANSIGTAWNYTGKDGQQASFYSPLGDSTVINAIDVTKPISYRSLFLPEKKAIDTFYTALKTL